MGHGAYLYVNDGADASDAKPLYRGFRYQQGMRGCAEGAARCAGPAQWSRRACRGPPGSSESFAAPLGVLDNVRGTWLKRATYRILHFAHFWQVAAVTQEVVHNHAVRKLKLNDECIERGVRVAHERAHEGLCDFVRTEERREERAILGRWGAQDVPTQGCLEVYRAANPDTSISTSTPVPTQRG
jgi:hypothetical protein